MKRKVLIFILGGGLVRDGDNWRSTTFFEKTQAQSLGDRYRVVAAAELYKQLRQKDFPVTLVASGGRGVTKDLDHPVIADVYVEELVALGVPKNAIIKDRKTGKTFEELLYLKKFSARRDFDKIYIISNKYHIPRTQAMLRYFPSLASIGSALKSGKIVLASAESILLKADRAGWKDELDKGYASAFMADRIKMEKRGVRQIKNGTYH